MTDVQTVSSEVVVAVDPDTVFRAFTEELDLWWVRGPINFGSDAHRVVEVRCEPGVGGRIMDVLDRPDSGEVSVRAHITAGSHRAGLCWDSADDDVTTEVSFTSTGAGTLVRVGAHDPDGRAGPRRDVVEPGGAEMVRGLGG